MTSANWKNEGLEMRKGKKIALAVAAALVLAGGALGIKAYQNAQYQKNHIFVEKAVYARDSEWLDLRGSGISVDHYEALREQLPECDILWDVPFQGGYFPSDATELTVTTLNDEDVALLAYFPDLAAVDATNCTDYPQLLKLEEQFPECDVRYQIILCEETYPKNTSALTFTEADPDELLDKLKYFPLLKTVHFEGPVMAAESLLQLRKAYPDIAITWELDVFGTACSDAITELDLSGIAMETVDYVEAIAEYFPDLEKLILCECGIDNETMAQFRERAREDYKVVWSVQIGPAWIRTDETTFMPKKYEIVVNDNNMKDLVYCEDLICVDLGHKYIGNLDWIYGTPHLQYLIVADTLVTDLTPIGTLKELIYLEVFLNPQVTDYSPLVGCTALQDVNVANTSGDASVFAQMPWLNNLWVNNCNVDDMTRELLTASLPDTTIEFDNGWHMGNNWRGLLNYFKMRDLLEMPYYDWGNTLGRPGDPGYPYDDIPDE